VLVKFETSVFSDKSLESAPGTTTAWNQVGHEGFAWVHMGNWAPLSFDADQS